MTAANTLPPNLPSRYRDPGKQPITGGFGEGRILFDDWLNREVLLKTINDPTDRATLDQEVSVVSRVTSKHVVRIFDVIRDAAGACDGIIYEYLPGHALFPGQFSSGSAVQDYFKVLYQLSIGLSDIHAAQIVHRDIKLQNMKYDSEGILKIFDFGISSDVGDITTIGRGTRIFLAPELFGHPASVAPSVDVYALGVCSVALITSAVPSPLAEIPPQSQSRMPSVATMRSDLPVDLVDLIDRALDIDPSGRPDSLDFRDCLRRNLVQNQHRATFSGLGSLVQLDKNNRSTMLRRQGIGEIQIDYNGTNFIATHVSGELLINNQPVVPGTILQDSCVIIFGVPDRGPNRGFVELNCSRPEVVL